MGMEDFVPYLFMTSVKGHEVLSGSLVTLKVALSLMGEV